MSTELLETVDKAESYLKKYSPSKATQVPGPPHSDMMRDDSGNHALILIEHCVRVFLD
jgi:hypothetical protein